MFSMLIACLNQARAIVSILLVSFCALVFAPITDAASGAASALSLQDLLNADGTLNVPKGTRGSIDATGFQLVSNENEPPRFAPIGAGGGGANLDRFREPRGNSDGAPTTDILATPGDENWASGFNMVGAYGVVNALAVDSAGNVFVGGEFTHMASLRVNRIAKWNGSAWSALGYGFNNPVHALAVDSANNVYAGGEFDKICDNASCSSGTDAKSIAVWNGSAWSNLGGGPYAPPVYALAVDSADDVYVGGQFFDICTALDCSTTITVNNVAKWDGAAWSALNFGVFGEVRALAVDGTNLYAGGAFTQTCADVDCNTGTTVNRIALWNGSAWSALSFGLDGDVRALAVDSTHALYVGGEFAKYCTNDNTCATGTDVNKLAKWDGTNWNGVSFGVNGSVWALSVDASDDLFVGGYFDGLCNDAACSSPTSANNIAKWDGASWDTLDDGLRGGGGSGDVRALARNSGNIVAGGAFYTAGTVGVNGIALWNGMDWSALGTGNGLNSTVLALAFDSNGNLYAGGSFIVAGTTTVNRVAKWNGTSWSALGYGLNEWVYALAVDSNDDVYAGGSFWSICNNVDCTNLTDASYIAKWDGATWSDLDYGLTNTVRALAVDSSNNVYAGGDFIEACADSSCSGTITVNRVAKWDGSDWSALDYGVNSTFGGSSVRALEIVGSNLYAGGDFSQYCDAADCSTGTRVNSVARWDGNNWNALDFGLAGTSVNALAADSNGNVYAGGPFYSICGDIDCNNPTDAFNIAKWDGTDWSAEPFGLGGAVHGIAFDNAGSLYAGGDFTFACDDTDCNATTPANRIARWDGASWNAMGDGIGDYVLQTLAYYGGATGAAGNLFAGGDFHQAGDERAGHLAQWTAGDGAAVTGTGSHTFYDNNLPVIVDVTAQGDLARINLQRHNTSYAPGGALFANGYYWEIEGLNSAGSAASGFTVTLTLPTTYTPTAASRVCRFTGGTPTCGDDPSTTFTSDSVTRSGITSFSPWASSQSAPTAVTLLSFRARRAANDRVRLKWETGSELNVVGFNLWRAGKRGDKFVQVNDKLINAQSIGQLHGAKYSFHDKQAKPNRKYRYKLEILFASGGSEWSNVISAPK